MLISKVFFILFFQLHKKQIVDIYPITTFFVFSHFISFYLELLNYFNGVFNSWIIDFAEEKFLIVHHYISNSNYNSESNITVRLKSISASQTLNTRNYVSSYYCVFNVNWNIFYLNR